MRAFAAQDRAAVRHVCFVTGYMGEPISWQWRDAESFADLFTGYYTDAEAESALVVEIDGSVVGYLLGCVDTTKAWKAPSVIARHVLRRGIAVRPGTAGVLWRSFADAALDSLRGHPVPRPVVDPRWPAHLHIDLLREARGQGAGAALVRRWLDALRSRAVAGCHLETIAENTAAIAFFEAMGFERQGRPTLAPGLRSPDGGRHHIQLMVQPLAPVSKSSG